MRRSLNASRGHNSLTDVDYAEYDEEVGLSVGGGSPRRLREKQNKKSRQLSDPSIDIQLLGDPEIAASTRSSSSSEDHVLLELDQEIRAMEKELKTWRRVSGMHTLQAHILEQLHCTNDTNNDTNNKSATTRVDVNDVTLSVINGISEQSKENFDGVLETSVVAALLMTFSVPMAWNPPDFIQYRTSDPFAKVSTMNWLALIHLYGWSIMSILGMMIIMYGRVYTSAVARAARDSDRLRIQMAGNAFNEMLYMLFAMTHFFGWGIFADTSAVFGYVHGIIITLMAYVAVMISVHMGAKYIRAGHIEYGWRAKALQANHKTQNNDQNSNENNHHDTEEGEDPVDDYLAFQLLHKKMEYAKLMAQRVAPKSVFAWGYNDNNNHSRSGVQNIDETNNSDNIHHNPQSKKPWSVPVPIVFEAGGVGGPTGLSDDGKQLFFGLDKKTP
ncbi:expressed unknown protein [Seminavis robusta]|uniref:Uncharacterized protein n=1 Tax=Seminavis robusta TaxID=568900 RepID=A0A9N8HBS7_9STRA|nr:expressed unknown protein [Seminavis robusta]|eukprot:Sro376_g129810.1 n/a (443) ;mRNA; f:54864-56192